jgi:predicted DNA-binding transcriptional regulator YafY
MSYGKARELLALALFVAGRTGRSLADIEQEFGCDRRRAQRMLSALRDLFPQLIRRTDDERRPRWSLPPASIASFTVPSPDELAALAHAIQALNAGPARAEVEQLRQLDAKVWAMVPQQLKTRTAVDEEALLECMGLATRPGPRPVADPQIDELIGYSLKARQRLRILYASGLDAAARWRTIEPYGLLLGARRYLVGVDTAKRGNCRYYRVDSIKAAEHGEGYFEVDPLFEFAEQAKKGFGTYESPAEYGEVIWRFSSTAAAHAQRFQFHPDQKLALQEDGSLIVRFTASGHLEMAWHLYMWGDKVEVLAPSALRELVAGYQRADFPALP